MDYSIVIAGNVDDTDDPDVEDELLESAQELVTELEGVNTATFSSPNFQNINLLEEEDTGE